MSPYRWQKSSHCQEGDACVHISATPGSVHLTESADPAGGVLALSPTAFGALLDTLKTPPRSGD